MKPFKFACPVCGQHITADAEGTGSQIECPTCYQKIVVPQAPASDDSKFILSAAQVKKPRPTTVVGESTGTVMRQHQTPWLAIAAGLVLVVGVAAAIVFRDNIFKSKPAEAPVAAESKKAVPASAPVPVIADPRWNLDLTEVAFAETPAEGKIHGTDFTCDRAYMQNGSLILRKGTSGNADVSVSILLAKQGETMAQSFSVNSTSTAAPKVTLKWKKEDNSTASLSFSQGYGMKLELGYLVNGKVDGKIYLCTPDDLKSFVTGTFTAEVKMKKAKK